jgi:hypothetical protein
VETKLIRKTFRTALAELLFDETSATKISAKRIAITIAINNSTSSIDGYDTQLIATT